MSQEFTYKTQQEIEAYVTHSMTEEETASFHIRMQNDELLKQEVLLQISIHQAFNDNDWAIQNNANAEEIKNITKKINSPEHIKNAKNIKISADAYFKTIENDATQNERFPIYKIAIAATILLLICIPFFLTQDSLQSQYKTLAHWEDIPSFIEKGGTINSDIKGEELFRAEKYRELINYYTSSSEYSPYSLMYLGIAHLEVNNTDQALQLFDQLIASNSIERSRGYWYKLLVYLKVNNKDKAKKMLDIILASEDNYNYKKALLLAKEI